MQVAEFHRHSPFLEGIPTDRTSSTNYRRIVPARCCYTRVRIVARRSIFPRAFYKKEKRPHPVPRETSGRRVFVRRRRRESTGK